MTTIINGYLMHSMITQQPQSTGYNLGAQRNLSVIDRITVHHTASNATLPTLTAVNNWWSSRTPSWDRAGYHFLIRGDGSIWQLVPIHAPSWGGGQVANPRSIHIAIAGSFTTTNLPSQEARQSFASLCQLLLTSTKLPSLTNINHIVGHRDWSATACPGFSKAQYQSWINSSGASIPPKGIDSDNPQGFMPGDIDADFRVSSETLNVRSQRNASSPIARVLRRGDIVHIRWILGINGANPINTPWGSINGASNEFINMNFVERVDTRFHIIQSGDTLWSIAQRFGVTVASIQQANKMENSTTLRIGQRLIIPS